VTVYDPVGHVVVTTNAYTVSGASVVLSGYPTGTNYNVEFLANPSWVAFRIAGAPGHVRPFAQTNQPRRFRLQTLDLWTRQLQAGDIPVGPS
jgi:hypothetical protein